MATTVKKTTKHEGVFPRFIGYLLVWLGSRKVDWLGSHKVIWLGSGLSGYIQDISILDIGSSGGRVLYGLGTREDTRQYSLSHSHV